VYLIYEKLDKIVNIELKAGEYKKNSRSLITWFIEKLGIFKPAYWVKI
jgi:predicted helicase